MNANLKRERDLLERMVTERDEKITILQKSLSLQRTHLMTLQSKHDAQIVRHRQICAKHKLACDSLKQERDLALVQLGILQEEREKDKDDPIELALSPIKVHNVSPVKLKTPPVSPKSKQSTPTKSPKSPGGEPKSPVQVVDTSHAIKLQSRLYHAMKSLASLQEQAKAMKNNYDDVVDSLEQDLLDLGEEKSKIEVELLTQVATLEREKDVMEGLHKEQVRGRDLKIKRLERKVQRSLKGITDDESLGDDEEEEEDTKSEESDKSDDTARAATDATPPKNTAPIKERPSLLSTSSTPRKVPHDAQTVDTTTSTDAIDDRGSISKGSYGASTLTSAHPAGRDKVDSLLEDLEIVTIESRGSRESSTIGGSENPSIAKG